MNLMSCKQCGVVLDKNEIRWRLAYDDDGNPLPGTMWNPDRGEFEMPESCPVCDANIYEEE